ncbi:MAG: hypothetical protein NT170_03055 [Candidatus Moranbacteria bacterium]|nr:hypothetical protein [Candidatus Moranbacteria bacterium]
MSIVTSGFLPEENLERTQLTRLLQKSYIRRLTLALSFNIFNPKLSDRFVNTLSLIINSEKILRCVAIKMSLGCFNFKDSFRALDSAFKETEKRTSSVIEPYLVIPFWQRLPEIFSSTAWSRERYRFMDSRVFAWPCAYVVDNKTNWLRVLELNPISLAIQGRAKNLKNLPLYKYDFCATIFWPSERNRHEISISADGVFYPRCCFANNGIQLGKLSSTSIPEVFKRKKQFQTKMLRLLLTDKREYTPEEMCDICRNFKKTHFDF